MIRKYGLHDTRYLKLDGSNANSTIDISTNNFTTTGNITDGTYQATVAELASYTITFDWDGEGTAIGTGASGLITIPVAGTLVEWYLVADVSTTTTIDVWAAAGAVPTNANTITNGHEPALSTATVAVDTNISDWGDVAMAEGDVLRANIDANDNAKFLSLVIKIIKDNT